jgi:AraC-like DNA-binding protein
MDKKCDIILSACIFYLSEGMIMKNQSLFSKLFFLLILFIIVPVVIIAGIISYQMSRYTEDEISKSAISKLKVADKLTELSAENMAQRALEMTKNASLIDLQSSNKFSDILSSSEELMKLYDIQNQIIGLASSSASLHSVYLYIDGYDYILTSNQGAQYIGDFPDTGWMPSYEKFRNAHSGSNWLSTRTVRYSKDSTGELGASNKVTTFFYSFTPYTSTVKGVLVFNLYEPSIRKMVNDDKALENGSIRIVNTSGYIVSDINDNMIGKNVNNIPYIQKIISSQENEGYLIDGSGSKRMLVAYYKSDYNNWIYMGIFQASNLMSNINHLRSFILIICLTLIIAGITISYFTSKKIYSPLNNLLQDIRQKRGIDIKGNDNDMAILSRAYDNLMSDRDKLSSIIEHKKSNKYVYLTNLLKGKNDEYFDKELTGIDFISDNYICAVVTIDRYNEFETVYSKEQQEYMRMFIVEISEELLNCDFKCAGMVYEKKKIALIINYEAVSDNEIIKALSDAFVRIQSEVSKIMDNTISIGIGNCQDSKDGINESFDKALEALRYKLTNGYGSINIWEEVYNVNSFYYYPFTHEKYIFNILNAGIGDKLVDAISELIQEIRNNKELQYDNIIQIFNQLIGNTIKYLLDSNCNVSMIFGNNYNIYNALSKQETLYDIEQWLNNIYAKIVDYLVKESSQSKSHFERALEYIHKNFRSEVDLNQVADYAGISYSHLRKIFKDETGENIVNYINSLRINESKQLLCSTDLTLKEISATLGYNNDQSYVRFFKKYEGITPGEFRVSNRSSHSSAASLSVQE